MTVAELMEKLAKLDPTALIVFPSPLAEFDMQAAEDVFCDYYLRDSENDLQFTNAFGQDTSAQDTYNCVVIA